MGWWSERLVPRLVDRALRSEEFADYRRDACRGLAGTVLELGFGSGLNVPHYPAAVERVLAVEPADLGWRLSAPRREQSRIRIDRVGLDGARLPVEDRSVDAVLSTWTLCTIPQLAAALGEVERVLRPGGVFHFLEHGLSPDSSVAGWQRRFDPWQQRLLGGCHLVRDIPSELAGAGLLVTDLDQFYPPGPRFGHPFSYLSAGRAIGSTPESSPLP